MKSLVLFGLGGLTIAALYIANALAGCGPQSTDAPPLPQSAPSAPAPVVGQMKMKLIRQSTPPAPPACTQQRPAATAPKKTEDIEGLIARLEAIKAQKADLDRAEKEVLARLKDRLDQQKQRLQKLGVGPVEVPVPVVPPISY